MELKLYVWEGVLALYTYGMACALAHSAEEAKELLVRGGLEGYWDGVKLDGVEPTVHSAPFAAYVYGGG